MAPEFRIDGRIAYLNHAAVSPWPQRTVDAVRRFAEENGRQGSYAYRQWLAVEAELREQARRLINASSAADIALLKSTSEGLSVVAWGLDWRPGDEVVIPKQEFPSNRVVWESLRGEGVHVRQADLAHPEGPEAGVVGLIGPRTRLVSVSSVQYASGLRLDLETLGDVCRARGVLFCVDAIQSLGAIPFDVTRCRADFVVADGHKWMLGPEGVALFYASPEGRARLRLRQYGWHMVEHAEDFDRKVWEVARNARRFECGSPNSLGIHALHASLSLLLETGLEQVSRNVLERSSYLYDSILEMGYELLTPWAPDRRAGIVTFRHPVVSANRLNEALADAGVMCAVRGGGVRLSPHFYTTYDAMDRALDVLARSRRT
jgi:selenocysteine lyase/cysteine desulfurase